MPLYRAKEPCVIENIYHEAGAVFEAEAIKPLPKHLVAIKKTDDVEITEEPSTSRNEVFPPVQQANTVDSRQMIGR